MNDYTGRVKHSFGTTARRSHEISTQLDNALLDPNHYQPIPAEIAANTRALLPALLVRSWSTKSPIQTLSNTPLVASPVARAIAVTYTAT